jgi:hypothetical protein
MKLIHRIFEWLGDFDKKDVLGFLAPYILLLLILVCWFFFKFKCLLYTRYWFLPYLFLIAPLVLSGLAIWLKLKRKITSRTCIAVHYLNAILLSIAIFSIIDCIPGKN